MERHFTLPIALAAALHGALLFAFTRSPVIPSPRPEKPRSSVIVVPLHPPEPETVSEEELVPVPAKGKPAPAAPSGAEPPVVPVLTAPVMELPTFRPQAGGDGFEVPRFPFGLPEGSESGIGVREVLPGSLLDNPPRARLQGAPFYPAEGRREGLSGEVLVEFVVDEEGRVAGTKAVNASHRMFEEPALRAVAKWRFEPGRRNGRIVRFRMLVPVVFSLHE